ncbi:peptidylprolyl isomerase [Runella sp. MFBS21]|uniref:peptidylprolyl isomerase n=1 Tax=Runella sp. MFBS21 TaxID=3034018 RepID=UPI0023F8B49E|nr:peptidylprolyl isomerase [Runella sp. MFBS21]MDF7819716.1 peptidylprolyl isomerase [Runella sp. MFBS21]
MKNSLLAVCFLVATTFVSFAQKVKISTTKGNIIVELYADKAPLTVANFLRYVDEKRYDGAKFYRVVRMDNQATSPVKIEVIQGGLQNDSTKMLPPIPQETTNKTGILHVDGAISMARGTPESGASEFFICINPQPDLDFGGKRNPDGQGFAAFGKVVKGMEVVKKIQQGVTGQNGPTNAYSNPMQLLKEPVIIKSARRVK